MWRDVGGWLWALLTLSHELKQNREDVLKLQSDVERLSRQMERVISDIDHLQAYEKSERINLRLELENRLLQFEQRLPLQD